MNFITQTVPRIHTVKHVRTMVVGSENQAKIDHA